MGKNQAITQEKYSILVANTRVKFSPFTCRDKFSFFLLVYIFQNVYDEQAAIAFLVK